MSIMEQPIFEGVDEIDSFDSFYSNVYFDKATLVMPYINLGLGKHPLNPGERLKFLDFAYVVFLGLRYLKAQKGVILGEKDHASSILCFGGFNMDSSPDLIDLEVGCEFAYLQPLRDSRLSDTFWVPVESATRNLDETTVTAFFRGDCMPESIRQLMAK
jgi:hypothetical protein